jgi:hypothetical protein
MRLLNAIIGGLIGGAIGALIWAGIAYATNYEIGWIAVGIGVLVGIGVRVGAKEDVGVTHGVLAAVLALGSIAAGKYITVEWVIGDMVKKSGIANLEITDEMLTVGIAGQLVEEYTAKNRPLKWPEGMTAEEASQQADYPADLWKDAAGRFASLSDEQKKERRTFIKSQIEAGFNQARAGATGEAFMASFGAFDLLWAFLAVGAAFKLGSGTEGDE